MIRWLTPAAILVACGTRPVAPPPANTTLWALTDVQLVDPSSEGAPQRVSILVDGNRIREVQPSLVLPPGTRVIEGGGRFVMPGLCDLHVHVFNNSAGAGTDNHADYFPLMIANGVTCARDMWTDAEDIVRANRWERERASGTRIAPRLAFGSAIVDGAPTSLPNMLSVATPEEGRAAVRRLAAGGAGFIKVYWNLTLATYDAIADEARRVGLAFAGHVPFAVRAAHASELGQKSIEHLTGIAEGCSSQEDELVRMPPGPERGKLLSGSFDAARCDALVATLARNRTWQTPTLTAHRNRILRDQPAVRDAAALRFANASDVQHWRDLDRAKLPPLESRQARLRQTLDLVRDMQRRGVPLLAGTDVGNPFVVAGESLHDELELFVEAGLTPREALATATIAAARFLGRENELGSVTRGKLADFVLLDADPLDRIANTRSIHAVVADGRYLSRAELDAMRAAVAARVAKQ